MSSGEKADASLFPVRRKGSVPFLIILLVTLIPGCALFQAPEEPAAPRPVVEQPPLSATRFVLDEPGADVVGEIQVIRARDKDTFIDIAQAYDLGYDELVEANPGVDPWLPGEGTVIVLPSRFVLPAAPRQGIVLNVATKRLFYFPKSTAGQPVEVYTFPISIGREGWATPLGSTRVVSKVKDPPWRVPASIRREHAENGDPLPAVVPPGPDNPLGRHAMRLAIPGDYLIHGTNKPAGVGMRISHGCIRMNPEDIEWLFPQVPIGLPVHIVNQPLLVGARGGDIFLEAHAPLEEDKARRIEWLLKEIEERLAKRPGSAQVDYDRVAAIAREQRGFPVSILEPGRDAAATVQAARPVTNIVTYDWFAEEQPATEPNGKGDASLFPEKREASP
jgi:L,D-transpeptidase ErfK/SrfK